MKTDLGEQPEPTNSLEIEEDPAYQRRIWKIERIAWVSIAALILAALLGLFGGGLLSEAQTSDASGSLQVEYARLARLSAPIRLQLHALAPRAGEARFWVSRAYLDGMRVESISPPPERVETSGDKLIYLFRVTDAATPLDITFHLTAQQTGRLRGQTGTDWGAQASFHSFIYP